MTSVRRIAPEAFAGQPADVLAQIEMACRVGDGRDPLDEAARLRLRHHGLDGSALWLAEGGFALVRGLAPADSQRDDGPDDGAGQPAGDGAGPSYELDVAVSPEARRLGTGRALVAAALAGLTPGGVVRAWSHADHPGAAALARAFGFARARELLVMRRALGAAEAEGANDLRLRTYRPGDAAELLRVNAAAFSDHPEQGALDAAGLAERMAEQWFDPAGLLVAVGGDRLLGFHWTKVHAGGQGEVYVLAVDPAAQGLGLGRALTDAGLRHLASRGTPSVHLYVEATNAAALALYRGRGFEQDHTHVQYERT